MEKKNSGLSLVMKILVTLGAVILIAGIFLPGVKLDFKEVKGSDDFNEYLEMSGSDSSEVMQDATDDIRQILKDKDEESLQMVLSEEETVDESIAKDIIKLQGKYSYISNYKSVDNVFGTKLSMLKLVIMIAAIVLALAAVLCAWLNVPVVSIITGLFSGGASVGFFVFLLIKDFTFDIIKYTYGSLADLKLLRLDKLNLDMVFKFKFNFGFFILIAGAVVIIISSIILTISNAKSKKAVTADNNQPDMSNTYNNFANDNAMNFQDNYGMDDQPTVALVDTPPVSHQDSVQNQNSINVGVLVLDGAMKGVKIPIEEGSSLNVGKDPQMAQLVMDKTFLSVSRLHCTISFSSQINQYYVTDNSSNGTFKSDGTRLMKGQRTAVPRQTIIYLASDNCKIKLL